MPEEELQESDLLTTPPPGYLLVLDYLFVVMRRWPYVLFGLVAGLAVAGLVWKYSDRVYESRCTLLVERYATPASFGAPVLVLRGDWLATETELVRSELVLHEAANRLDGSVSPSEIAANLVVENPRGTQLISLRYRSSDPYKAQAVLQAVMDAYRTHFEKRTRGYQDRLLEWYQKKEPELQAAVVKAENERMEIQKKLGYSSLEAPQKAVGERLKLLSERITELKLKRAETAARLAALQSLSGDSAPQVLIQKFPEAGALSSLATHLLDLSEDLAVKEKTLGPNHPDVTAIRTRIEEIRRRIKDAVPHIENSLRTDLAILDRTIEEQEKELAAARAEADETVNKATLLEKARAKEERAKQIYEPYLQRLSELSLTQSFKSGWVEVVDAPKVPRAPIWPSTFRLAFGGIFGGLIFGIFLAFMRENMEDAANVAEDVLHIWRLPILGFIPHLSDPPKLDKNQELARSGRADVEALRMLAVSLDTLLSRLGDQDEFGRVVVLTSAGSREGKTLLSVSTGIMLAHSGKKTLLVDADFRRRGLSKLVEMKDAPGINAWFRHHGDIKDYIVQTPVPNLDVLPAGRWSEGPALMFRQEVLHALLEDLRKQYRYILVDVPPMTFVSDALTLVGSAARMIMVSRMGETSKRLLRRAKHLADTAGIQVAGIVINDFDSRAVYYGYYYRYYGYYQYYKGYDATYEDDEVEARAPSDAGDGSIGGKG